MQDGHLITFDEAGFTGPQLLDEDQPYFVYASHDLTEEEAAALITELRRKFRLQGDELKSKRLKKRGDWSEIVASICTSTQGRSKVVVHDKKAALTGKFFEYFFEPVLEENSIPFYRLDFHRYLMTTIYLLLQSEPKTYATLAKEMQAFMRTFDPAVAPSIFHGAGSGSIEMERVLAFCKGYAQIISEQTKHLRKEADDTAKWTLDLTTTALYSLLFHFWGHRHRQLRLLCDDSKPLKAGAELFNTWVGQDKGAPITDGKSLYEIRGNLARPVEFGSSETHSSIQVADLLAGMTLDAYVSGRQEVGAIGAWLKIHQMHNHCIGFMSEFTKRSDPRVKAGREILKELARRAATGMDPLKDIDEFFSKLKLRFQLA